MRILRHGLRASVLLCAMTGVAAAQDVKPGCSSDPGNPIPNGNVEFKNTEHRDTIVKDGVTYYLLDVKKAANKIADCDVNLRSYNGHLVGNTLRVRRGETLRVWVVNNLENNPPPSAQANPNIPPHMPNTTNFDSHGLHVDPNGISDNVLRLMPPKGQDTEDKSQYAKYNIRNVGKGEYPVIIDIPDDHPTGTFWYHAHVHGSTAMQVSSGMAGALIVLDNPAIPGGTPSLASNPDIGAAKDQIMVLQQTAYDEQGVIDDYVTLETSPSWWAASNRRTTINGQIAPVIKMRPGEVQRWRLIHGGVNEAININLEGSEKIQLQEIATDGLASGRCDTWDYVTLYPGYRSDVLIKAPTTPGTYMLVDAVTSNTQSLLGGEEQREVLATLEVAGAVNDMKLPCQPGELAKYKAMKDVTAEEQSRAVQQPVSFGFQQATTTEPRFGRVDTGDGPQIYDPDAPALELFKGDVGQWILNTGSHPFHIHVNAFQTTRPAPAGSTEPT